MSTKKFTIEIVEEREGIFWIRCENMNYSSYTKNPESVVEGLFREWLEADMGDAFVPLD